MGRDPEADADSARRLAAGLLDPAAYPHPVGPIRLVETHISRVFLTGPFAYKVKKPVRLEFLDFSTLERRRHFCAEEVRVNRRFAPGLYVEAVPIGGTPDAPRVEDAVGPAIEWGVKLVQFDEAERLDARFEAGRLSVEDCHRLGAEIARIEATLATADPASAHGTPERVAEVFAMNVGEIARLRPDLADRAEALARRFTRRLHDCAATFLARKAAGRVRECHGDLHLGNLVFRDGRPVAFDAIEFSDDLRWIDVASDLAFLTMDLESRGRRDLAAVVTSAWMEESGDHAAAAVLPTYRIARAIVRAAVAAIRAAEEGCPAAVAAAARSDAERHLALAERLADGEVPLMFVVTGVSGSGKSTLARRLVACAGAVGLSSDIERKRLFGMRPVERPADGAAAARLYGTEATRAVYERLAALAHDLLAAGSSVVVDATCGARWQRDLLATAAARAGRPLAWLEIDLPETTLRERVESRLSAGGDPSDATPEVLSAQLAAREPIGPGETAPDAPRPVVHILLRAGDLDDPWPWLGGLVGRWRAGARVREERR